MVGRDDFTVEVQVTKQDIERGRERIADGGDRARVCPIALALKREIYYFPKVGIRNVYAGPYKAPLGSEVKMFMGYFDGGYEVGPSSFKLHFERR